jgi:cyclophilin family peptidyl-prolyl cis-trans isomerase
MNAQLDSSPGWLQENSRFLVLLAIVLLGGGALGWYLPRAKQANLLESWGLLGQFTDVLQTAESFTDINAALLPVQGDERAYPWALARAVAWASYKQDLEAIDALQAKIGELEPTAAKLRVLEDGQSAAFLTALNSRLNGLKGLTEMEAVPLEPTGSKVKFTLTSSDGMAYELVYQLYSEQAPRSVAHFLSRLEAGAFEGASFSPGAQGSLQLGNLDQDDAPALAIEKAFGCFHNSGALCTIIQNGGDPGAQSSSKLQFLSNDLYAQDGITTVLGQLIEGESVLEQIAAFERASDNPGDYASSYTLKAEVL